MANNDPTNLAKGGEKKDQAKDTVEDILKPAPKTEEAKEGEEVAPPSHSSQEGADLALEQSQGKVFGDTTSTNGDTNQHGFHGRDGGTTSEGFNNPAPSEEAINPTPPETPENDHIPDNALPSEGA